MQKEIKIYFLYPFFIVLFFLFFYALFLWSTNFTPRMFFYTQKVDFRNTAKSEAEFTIHSEEDYLGIISISSLGEYVGYDAKSLKVSLIDLSNNQNVHTNRYNAYDLTNISEFPFGFPVQENSKNKTYKVILQISCFDQDSCVFEPDVSDVIVRHYFSKKYLFSNPDFIIKKIANNFLNQGIDKNLMVIVIPLIIYFTAISLFAKQVKLYYLKTKELFFNNFSFMDIIIYIVVISDLTLQKNSLFFVFVMVAMVVLSRLDNAYKEQLSFRNTIITFILSIIFLIINIRSIGDRISIWTFSFLLIYIYQIFLQKDSSK